MKDRIINLSISQTSELLIPSFQIRSFTRCFYILIFFFLKIKESLTDNNNNNDNKGIFTFLKKKKNWNLHLLSFMQFLIFSPLISK